LALLPEVLPYQKADTFILLYSGHYHLALTRSTRDLTDSITRQLCKNAIVNPDILCKMGL
jgi:hypothetical protein